jgi:hypothetical protein
MPMRMQIVSAGSIKPERVTSALDAYRVFADKKAGGMKVELRP